MVGGLFHGADLLTCGADDGGVVRVLSGAGGDAVFIHQTLQTGAQTLGVIGVCLECGEVVGKLLAVLRDRLTTGRKLPFRGVKLGMTAVQLRSAVTPCVAGELDLESLM